MKRSLLALLAFPAVLTTLQLRDSPQQGRQSASPTPTPSPCPGDPSQYDFTVPDFFPQCYPAKPRVQFIFVGACNFQVESKRVNVWMLDSPATCLGGDCGDGKLGHPVQDHRAMLQFSGKFLQTQLGLPSCPNDPDCQMYDFNRRDISLSVPARILGLHVDKNFTDYMVSMPRGTTLTDDPSFAEVSLRDGVLWATPADHQYHYSNSTETRPYQREVIFTVGLASEKHSFSAHVKGDTRIAFKYDKSDSIWVRILSISSNEACLTEAANHTNSMADHDFALNYLLAAALPPEPWPIPIRDGRKAAPAPTPPLGFCKRAFQLQGELDRLRASPPATVKRQSVDLIRFVMSSMGSDCIGARWP